MGEGKRTEYVVLRRGSQKSEGRDWLWETIGRASATSAKAAIAQCAGETSGSYVAVPARSFQPVYVTVAQKATLSFGEPPKSKEPGA